MAVGRRPSLRADMSRPAPFPFNRAQTTRTASRILESRSSIRPREQSWTGAIVEIFQVKSLCVFFSSSSFSSDHNTNERFEKCASNSAIAYSKSSLIIINRKWNGVKIGKIVNLIIFLKRTINWRSRLKVRNSLKKIDQKSWKFSTDCSSKIVAAPINQPTFLYFCLFLNFKKKSIPGFIVMPDGISTMDPAHDEWIKRGGFYHSPKKNTCFPLCVFFLSLYRKGVSWAGGGY